MPNILGKLVVLADAGSQQMRVYENPCFALMYTSLQTLEYSTAMTIFLQENIQFPLFGHSSRHVFHGTTF